MRLGQNSTVQTPNPLEDFKPNPKAMQRMIYVGFPDESPMLRHRVADHSGVYACLDDIPADEIPPSFVWINGLAISDDQIETFLKGRVWHPIMIRVVGRWMSRCQSFFGLTGAWVIPASMLVAVFLVVCFALIIRKQVI